ncbi:MAG: hypothetical protein HYY40_03845 [Bacteroidetes bacterium]|nr:hypothetical protein [Bacteroidota bacterium]
MSFADKGVLIPRIALTQTSSAAPVTSPATSLLVYNTDSVNDVTPGYYYWDGSKWLRLLNGGSPGNAWLTLGNAGTTSSTSAIGMPVNNNFIGTTDSADWVMATKNMERMRISSAGNVGIGILNPSERLEVSGNTRIGQSPATLTTLSVAMLSTDLTATVVSTAGYPGSGTLIIGAWPSYEVMSYTSTTATTFNGLTRGILGTVAAGWSVGYPVNISLGSFIKTSTASAPMMVTGSGSTFLGGIPGPVYSGSPGVLEINPTGSFSGLVLRNDPPYNLYFTNNMGTGTKIMMNGAGALTSGNGIYMGGGIANATTGFSGAFIRIEPSRTATATINDNGNFVRLTRSHAVNNAASTYTISGDLMRLYSNITQTAGTGIDNSSILSLNQAFINATGSVLKVDNSGTGNLATLDATNTNANGISVDVQSSNSGQYAFKATGNNGATTGLYIRADGNAGIGTTSPTSKLSVGASSEFQVNSTGNILRINDVPYSFPAVQGAASDFLQNDGAGNLTWAAGGSGTVTSVTGTVPVYSSGGTTPAISLQGTAGGIFYGTGGGSNISAAGSAGEVLISGGAGAPAWTTISTHTRLHSMTNTLDHSATAWRLFYSNGSGQVTELALVAAGQVLTSAGVAAAPVWSAGGTGTKVLLYNCETTASGNVAASPASVCMSYALAANTYSQIEVEANIGVLGNGLNSTWNFNIMYGAVLKKTVAMSLNAADSNGDSSAGVVSFAGAQAAAVTIQINVVNVVGSMTWYVYNMRVYGIK